MTATRTALIALAILGIAALIVAFPDLSRALITQFLALIGVHA